ncbi:glutamate-5-semialdehyde dehydrogenase [Vampirovibrio chlorellavorus]|uniref:glutamate-5-semialdehyde dehydrogenase n=1 Tax=Vampirovibrio chlorellavorus TaxID=758823 RepID=UPI0026EE0419|nr:glutamate-5-semialdehyde dehydrogenase [Vampirovibrio chlorellavorus]
MVTQSMNPLEESLKQSKDAFLAMSTLPTAQKNEALAQFAAIIEANVDFLLTENRKDIGQAEQDGLTPSLYQRLKLDAGKIKQLAQGLRDLIQLPDPAGQVLSQTVLDEGLVLEKLTVPLGVIGIIFESRPDVIPQILSLILKSGNAVVLKGGREASRSNAAFMQLVDQLNARCPFLPAHWATLLDSREAVQEMLNYPQYVDLVIPRGSNQLVQSIMAATKIPVLGHADGVCHLYVHASANIEQAVALAIDAKTQYPAACNALETLLVDAAIAQQFLPQFAQAAKQAGIALKGCSATQAILPKIEPATEADWRAEYGDLTLAVKVVPTLEAAMAHINQYGSHHTDAIVAQDSDVLERFLNGIDSACVFANASTRFADGFRFGLGAEIGISTAKTHARGPVGLEGLVIYKYKLRGQGQIVADYVGEAAKPFLHRPL